MNTKNYLALSGLIFAAIFIVHLLRVIYGWGFSLNDWEAPLGASWACLIVTGYLAWSAYRLMKK